MAFVDQDRSREKLLSGIASVTLVGVMGYAMVTGLAINIIRDAGKQVFLHEWKAEMPPPPPPEHKAIDKSPKIAHPVYVAKSIVPPLAPKTPQIAVSDTPIPPDTLKLELPPSLPPLQPDKTAGVTPRTNPNEWVTADDYPASALRIGAQGRTSFRLNVGTDGRPTACSITQSSGSTELDQAACRNLMQRARFKTATDAAGAPTPSSYSSSVVWRLPRD